MKNQTKMIATFVILASVTLTSMAADQNVENIQSFADQMQIKADKLDYNKETQEITASGNVVITGNGKTIMANKLVVKRDAQKALEKEVKNTVIKRLDVQDASLHDVVSRLIKETGNKINIIVKAENTADAPTVTMKLDNVRLYETLRYVCEVTGSEMRISDQAVVITSGKGTPPNTYGVKLKVSPVDGAANQFEVAFLISEKKPNGKEDLLSTPKITIPGGREGTGIIKVVDDGERNGVICTATVIPQANELQVETSVTIKQEGRTLWSCSQETTVKK